MNDNVVKVVTEMLLSQPSWQSYQHVIPNCFFLFQILCNVSYQEFTKLMYALLGEKQMPYQSVYIMQ